MRTTPGVARSYAKALFALAQERNQGEVIARELEAVAEVLATEPAFGAFLEIGRAHV